METVDRICEKSLGFSALRPSRLLPHLFKCNLPFDVVKQEQFRNGSRNRGLDDPEVGVLHVVQTGSGAHPTSYPMALFPGARRPGLEADHSPPTGAEVKKMRIYTFTSPYAFMA
jgi:hypothetical protein